MTAPPFIIYALPRSRTFWLSRFLSYRGWTCGHDEARHLRGLDDVRSWLAQPMTGTAETAAAPFWRLVQEIRPDLRVVVVRRPVAEVVDSLARTGLAFDLSRVSEMMCRLDAKLDQIAIRVPGVLSIRFDALTEEATCAQVFEHCLPARHDPAWWAALAPLNLQCNLAGLLRYQQTHAEQMARVARSAAQHIRGRLTARRVTMEGFTFQQEPFDAFLRDGTDLFAEHLVQVGEAPGAFTGKNLPLMRRLHEIGALHVTTARSNGRMFGYLMAITAPSLEAEGKLDAMHTTFFASAAAPGLGLKLQRASLDFLRGMGVHETMFRAGERGAGPRMGALYRRLGAVPRGEMYSLTLREAV